MHVKKKLLVIIVVCAISFPTNYLWLRYYRSRSQLTSSVGTDVNLQLTTFEVTNSTQHTRGSTVEKTITLSHLARDSTIEEATGINPNLPFVVNSVRIYLYSAVCVNCDTNVSSNMATLNKERPNTGTLRTIEPSTSTSYIAINGWQQKRTHVVGKEFTCCYIIEILSNETMIEVKSTAAKYSFFHSELIARQFYCRVPVQPRFIKGVSLVTTGKCPRKLNSYIKPATVPTRTQNSAGVAICAKLVYGNLMASSLVEWFEVQKKFGVSKVIMYSYDLNAEAMKVLTFYRSTGLLEVYPFHRPEMGGLGRHTAGVDDYQGWADEQTALFDCQVRLQKYKYMATIDVDEYIIPTTKQFNNAWITYLEPKFSSGNIAGIEFDVKFHLPDWGPTNESSSALYMERYGDTTGPMIDRRKHILMLSRVVIGSIFTHDYTPSQSYRGYHARSGEAIIHHYRTCRPEWYTNDNKNTKIQLEHLLNPQSTKLCGNFRRYPSDIIKKLAKNVSDDVVRIRKMLNIKVKS